MAFTLSTSSNGMVTIMLTKSSSSSRIGLRLAESTKGDAIDVAVTDVDPMGLAASSLKKGDSLISVDGEACTSRDQATALLKAAFGNVALVIRPATDSLQSSQQSLAASKANSETIAITLKKASASFKVGVRVTDSKSGAVLIEELDPTSRVTTVLRKGDQIVSINNECCTSCRQASQLLTSATGDVVVVIRPKLEPLLASGRAPARMSTQVSLGSEEERAAVAGAAQQQALEDSRTRWLGVRSQEEVVGCEKPRVVEAVLAKSAMEAEAQAVEIEGLVEGVALKRSASVVAAAAAAAAAASLVTKERDEEEAAAARALASADAAAEQAAKEQRKAELMVKADTKLAAMKDAAEKPEHGRRKGSAEHSKREAGEARQQEDHEAVTARAAAQAQMAKEAAPEARDAKVKAVPEDVHEHPASIAELAMAEAAAVNARMAAEKAKEQLKEVRQVAAECVEAATVANHEATKAAEAATAEEAAAALAADRAGTPRSGSEQMESARIATLVKEASIAKAEAAMAKAAAARAKAQVAATIADRATAEASAAAAVEAAVAQAVVAKVEQEKMQSQIVSATLSAHHAALMLKQAVKEKTEAEAAAETVRRYASLSASKHSAAELADLRAIAQTAVDDKADSERALEALKAEMVEMKSRYAQAQVKSLKVEPATWYGSLFSVPATIFANAFGSITNLAARACMLSRPYTVK